MDALERDTQLLDLHEKTAAALAKIGEAIAGLDRLDDERKGDIDELREEVAALGAKVNRLWQLTAVKRATPRQ